MRQFLLLVAITMCTGTARSADLSSTLAEPTLIISGNRTTTLRYQRYTGLDPRASGFFQSGFTRHDTTRLAVSGQVLERIKVEGEFFQNDVDLDNRYSLKLATDHYELFLGETTATLEGSEFTLFSRQIQGAKLTGEIPYTDEASPKIEFTAIASAPRGEPTYEKFFGTDTQGPYQLGGFPVVLNSEKVMVDKVPQARQVDYLINALTGQITFTKRIVERRSLVEVTYERRSTLYPRSLYGGQVGWLPSPTDALRINVVDERDRRNDDTTGLTGIPPIAHTVAGASYKHDGEYVRMGGEYAHSLLDADRTAKGTSEGNAYGGDAEVELFGVTLGGSGKRLEPKFRPMGNMALGNDFLGWSGHGGLGVGRTFNLTGRHEEQRTMLNAAADRRRNTEAKGVLSPKGWPRETYRFVQTRDTFEGNYDRTERRHTADISHTIKVVTVGAGWEQDRITHLDNAQPNQIWHAGRANFGVAGVGWLSLATTGELRKGRQTATDSSESGGFQTAIATANVSLTPHARYFLGANNSWRQTKGQPAQNTLRTEARLKPTDWTTAEGSFSQETLQHPYLLSPHQARADGYSLLTEVKPVESLSFIYQPTLRQTLLTGIHPPVNENRKEEAHARWALGSVLSTESSIITEAFRLRSTTQPDLPLTSRTDGMTWAGGMKLAPVKEFALDAKYQDKTDRKEQSSPVSPTGFDRRDSRRQSVNAGLKPQLESRLGMDLGYRFERFRQDGSNGPAAMLPGYSISPINDQVRNISQISDFDRQHTHEHEARTGISYQWLKSLISNASATYDKKTDNTGAITPLETIAGSAGATIRIRAVKFEAQWRIAQSNGSQHTKQQAVSASLDWTPAKQIRWTTRVEQSISRNPRSESTDLTTSLEISF